MATQVVKIDKSGRIKLPKNMRETFGFLPETDVLIELRDNGIFIKPKLEMTPITKRIASMELPVSDWNQMEKETEKGYLE